MVKKIFTVLFWLVIFALIALSIYSMFIPRTNDPVISDKPSTISIPVTQNGTTTTHVITRTITVKDPILQMRIDSMQLEINTLRTENAQLKASNASNNNTVTINNSAPVVVTKTREQLNAQYTQIYAIPNCNDRARYPITGHEQSDCYKDIQSYYANRNAWVDTQLNNQ